MIAMLPMRLLTQLGHWGRAVSAQLSDFLRCRAASVHNSTSASGR